MLFSIHNTAGGLPAFLGTYEAPDAAGAMDAAAQDRGWTSWQEWAANGGPEGEVAAVSEGGESFFRKDARGS